MTRSCPNCGKGNQSPCENCGSKWTFEEAEEVDESFEIISEKEKLWRDKLVEAETNFLGAEFNMKMSSLLIDLAKEEIKKEAERNKPSMVD